MQRRELEPALTPGSLWPARYAAPRVHEQELRARIGQMKRRGEIATGPSMIYYRQEGERGEIIAAYVLRIKPPPKRMGRLAALLVTAGVSAAGVAWALWEARYILLSLLVAALGIWWAATRTTHSGVCPGLHCSGCRG